MAAINKRIYKVYIKIYSYVHLLAVYGTLYWSSSANGVGPGRPWDAIESSETLVNGPLILII